MFPAYTQTASFRSWMSVTAFGTQISATGNQFVRTSGGTWITTAAITQINLGVLGGNFAAGSLASIYGWP
jgi:hypothetical protein